VKRRLRSVLLRVIPVRWHLPLQFWRYRITGYIEPEMLLIRQWKDKKSIAVDVGANQGIYSFELSRWFEHVESFEPNPNITADLLAYDSPRIRLHSVALSSVEGETNLHVPLSVEGTQLIGWGTLHPETVVDSPKFAEFPVNLRTLDSYCFDRVAFIKIDVEGHEEDVLVGADQTLRRCRPVVLAEVRPASRAAVQRFFSARDYKLLFLHAGDLHSLADAEYQPGVEQENLFAIPAEKAIFNH
jgi:FkbM family methyltransferase